MDWKFDCQGIRWDEVRTILQEAGMKTHPAPLLQQAFERSRVVFAFQDGQLVGLGRALTDGAYQAALYDVAVHPKLQGQGLGRSIVQKLLEQVPDCNVILYAAPGKEGFYRTLGFRKLTSGMALFRDPGAMNRFTISEGP